MRNNRQLRVGIRRTALAIAIGNSVFNPVLAAQLSELDEVLVQSSRDSSTAAQSKRATAVITRQQLDEQQPDSVAEALKYQPNIEIGGGPRASNQQPVIRGLSGARVLQISDGARQNFNAGHRGTYQIDPELLEQIDVTKGPAGSMWGSGAIGGVVAQTTRDARDMLKPEQRLGGYAKQGFSSAADQTKTSGAVYGRLNEQVDVLINGYYSDQNNIRLGNGDDLMYSSERDSGGMVKLGWQLDDNQRLTLSHRRSESSGAVPSNPAANVVDNSSVIDRESTDSNSILEYAFNPSSALINVDVSLFHNRTQIDEFQMVKGEQDSTDYRTVGLNLVNRSTLDWGMLTYGVDGFEDKSQGERSGPNRPIPADGRTQVMGGFLQADLPLADAWTLTPGLRYDHFKTEANNISDSQRSDDEWSKSLALSWQANDWLELIARYDEAFRAPTSEELYTTGTHFMVGPFSNSFVPNPDLKPEKAQNKELIARAQFVDLLANDDSLTLNASLFENRVTDFIETQVIMDFANRVFESRYQNVQNAKLRGGELAVNYRLQDLDLGLSYGRTLGKDANTGRALEGIPADKWVASVGYWLWDRQLKLGTQLTHADSVSADNAQYDDYTLLDVGGHWYGLEGIELGLTVDNLTDQYYQRAFSELYEAGRNVKVNALYRF
ncbi:TonB-dependent hemoglobin/transferrin/lactoferrin family receptor [Oceanisphaera profunda]|uniref:TonB-dependent hemoglobin/transferrin/lactoferrin family receptor n=1 Tax=Oceanisphaera profunda TaxID=1416627 RepID=UPI0013747A52|nr:TonB-dependent hemoglobin/transferrin/lactoferrin family receptor [Oceanisphaera profunda]